MASREQNVDRRAFLKTASSVVALGGGLYLASPGDAGASLTPGAGHDWDMPWRPASPKRLSEETRQLAWRALSGEHGRSMQPAGFALDEAAMARVSSDIRYGHACRLVAEKAPLRILPGEKVVGSATLREAAAHATPVAGGSSISHTTIGFGRVLRMGYKGLRREIEDRLARGGFEKPPSECPIVQGRHGKAFAASGHCGHWLMAASPDAYHRPPFTVECWAKLESKNGYSVIVANRNKESRHHWEIYTGNGNGRFSAYLPGYAPAVVESARDIVDGEWHFLAMTFDGASVRLVVDGEEVLCRRLEKDGQLGPGSGAFYIGGYPPHSIGCHGMVEDVRVSRVIRDCNTVPGGPLDCDGETLGLWRAGQTESGVAFRDLTARANHALPAPVPGGGEDLLKAMLMCLDAAARWHKRYMDELERLASESSGEERANYLRVAGALRRVPENPPETFHEAVQSLWFMYAFQRLMGTWSGIGRIDEMLWPYLEADLAAGRITLGEAREVLAHFWVKGCEWVGAFDTRGSGDAQHYQNIVLAGVDADGNEVANPVTYLVLDIVEELHISDFPIAVRLNANSPEKLLRRMAEVQRHGGGIVAAYNEDVVIAALTGFGYPLEEARCFANDGCWEMLIPGKTRFLYVPFDGLALLQDTLGVRGESAEFPKYETFEDLYAAFSERLARRVEQHHRAADGWSREKAPAPLVSMFVDGCIERGRAYNDRGPKYTVLAPHIGRLPNVANGLAVIKKLVYEDQYLTLPEFAAILRNDWEGQDNLRRLVQNRFTFYGNDNDETDRMMARLYETYTAEVARVRERNGVLRPAGISTFGREIAWRDSGASPDGHRRGELLATNCSPSPGTDIEGPTAVLKSYCKLDFVRCPNGATVELKVHPDTVRDERGIDALVALMRGFVRLGGMFVHIDVVDSAMLLDAQRHPEKYPNLSVRIAGWSARFATLEKSWQDMVIGRTQQYLRG